MKKQDIITAEIFKEINQKDRSYLYRSKSNDGITRDVSIFTYTKEDIERSLNEFNRTFGTSNDGLKVSINSNVPYLKIYTDMIFSPKYRIEKIIDLYTIFQEEGKSFFIFINGKKIPDKVIKIYTSNGGTDIFIPYSYLDLNKDLEIFIESIIFKDKEYVSFYSKSLESNNITIDLTTEDNYFDFSTLDNNKFLVFSEGLLTITEVTAEKGKNSNILLLTLNTDLTGREVEIFYDHGIVLKNKIIESYSTNKIYFSLPNNFESPIRAVIPKRNNAFYINGKRISVDKISQEHRQCYSYQSDNPIDVSNVTFYVHDTNLINNPFYRSYNSDYYIEKMIGNDRLLLGIKNEPTNSVFDNFPEISYSKILNNDGKRYDDVLSDEYINTSMRDEAADENFNSKVYTLIRRNPSLAKNFLEKFSRVVNTYKIVKNTQENEGNIQLTNFIRNSDENKEIKFIIYLNWKYIDNNNLKFEVYDDSTVISLPKKLLNQGDNYIEINEILSEKSYTQVSYLEYNVSDIQSPDSNEYKGTLVIPKDALNQIDSPDQLCILECIQGQPGYLYPNSKNIGYINFTDYDIDETENYYRINFKTKPKNKFLIYLRNFTYSGKFIYEKDGTDTLDALVYIYKGEDNNPIPILPFGIPDLYVNNKYFIYGIDYVFSTCLDNKTIAGSVISFIRSINKGDVVSYSFDGVDNKSLINSSELNYNSKYGLLYLSALEFPFSNNYLDLFIDGNKISHMDIDILSDKLIRVRNAPVPFKDVYVQTKFNLNYEDLRNIYDAYKEDEFELIIEKLFSSVDPNKMIQDQNYPIPDEIYENWENNVGEHPNDYIKTPNPENTDPDVVRQDLLTSMYQKWIVSSDARGIYDGNNPVGDKVHGYFKIYQFDSIEGSDIIIDSNKQEILADEDVILNGNVEPYCVSERLQMIINSIKENSKVDFTYDDLWDLFINDPISNIILPLDYPIQKDNGEYIGKFKNDVHFFEENEKINPIIIRQKEKFDTNISLQIIPTSIKIDKSKTGIISYLSNADLITVKKETLLNDFEFDIDLIEKRITITSMNDEISKGFLILECSSQNKNPITRKIYIEIIDEDTILNIYPDILRLKINEEKNIKIEYNSDDYIYEVENSNISCVKESNLLKITGVTPGETKLVIKAQKENKQEKIKNIKIIISENE